LLTTVIQDHNICSISPEKDTVLLGGKKGYPIRIARTTRSRPPGHRRRHRGAREPHRDPVVRLRSGATNPSSPPVEVADRFHGRRHQIEYRARRRPDYGWKTAAPGAEASNWAWTGLPGIRPRHVSSIKQALNLPLSTTGCPTAAAVPPPS
jgi:hypothetical protein